MRRRVRSAALAAALAGAGCATGASLRLESDALRAQLAVAREAGAYRCAPVELAIAEAHTEFLDTELDRGNPVRAAEHGRVARHALSTVLDRAQHCQAPDRDHDGVPDPEDRCPDVPGTPVMHGCPDRDGDGVADDVDACPDRPGPPDNKGCPWGDRDNDGVLDPDDACPDAAGPRENKGCPYGDKDGDGLADNVDECPDQAGPKENRGCPWGDRDGDGVADNVDACPDLPGPAENKGCPKQELVEVRRDIGKIEIKEKVFFDTGRATIKSQSYLLLNQVAAVLKSNPNMHVLVEGHTDAVGGHDFNVRLSDSRADAVLRYLVQQGVEQSRLTSQGFGPDKPIDSNRTARGREKNRRVEFTITKE